MASDLLPEVTSSPSRLKIAHLVSQRPYGLGELAAAAGISVQAVLKHLKKLEGLGLVEERSVRSPELSVRKVYVAPGRRLRDLSAGGLMLVKIAEAPAAPEAQGAGADLDELAEEAIVLRRRVRDQARRLGRMVDELVEDESRIGGAIAAMELTDTERLALQVLFAEESLQEGERVLLEEFGLLGGREFIRRALSKARRAAGQRPRKRRTPFRDK
jgi:DNA-binding transcriptional ArsR family regulator